MGHLNQIGQLVYDCGDLMDVILSDGNLSEIDIVASNDLMHDLSKGQFIERSNAKISPEFQGTMLEYDARNQSNWNLPPEIKSLTNDEILQFFLIKDPDNEDVINDELNAWIEYGYIDLLKCMIHIASTLESTNQIYATRGSGVASYLLYLLGLSLVNPLECDLELSEFIKELQFENND